MDLFKNVNTFTVVKFIALLLLVGLIIRLLLSINNKFILITE